MKNWIFLTFLILPFSNLIAQKDSTNNQIRFAILGGTALAPPIWNDRVKNDPMNIQFRWILFPPPFELELMKSLSEKTTISVYAGFRAIQNSTFQYNFHDPSGNQYRGDYYALKTNTLRFGSNCNLFFSPTRKAYLGIGAGFSISNSNVFSWQIFKEEDGYGNTEDLILINNSGYYRTTSPFVSLGIGRKILKDHGTIWDVGIRTSYQFGHRSYGYDDSENFSDFDYFDQLDRIIDRTVNANLNASYAMEIYVKVGSFFK